MFGAGLQVLSPFMSWWLRNARSSWRQMPTPGERPLSFSPGPNADRLLLIGSGIAVGYGVASPELGLGGHLARGLSAATGRGASVDAVARVGLRAGSAATVLAGFDLGRFDALVVTLGSDEALHMVTARSFRRQVTQLLGWIEQHTAPGFGVVMVGIPDATPIISVPPPIVRVVRRQCVRLDVELAAACAAFARVTYLPFTPAPADLEGDGDRHIYAAWAALLVPTVARVLDAQTADPRDPATIQEVRRQRALDDLGILDTASEARFDRIVESARDLFGVRGASIIFIDRDRQWTKAGVGIDPCDSPRGSALGDATVHNGKLLVVEDASRDERFSGHPWVAGGPAVRFFAGFPIEAANGERIGALCLSDPRPRRFTANEDALLGMLARQVEIELWGTPQPALT